MYTVNAGAETRWAITNAGGARELCWALEEEEASIFIERVLSCAAPGATFEVRLGAAEKTPYCWQYFEALKQIYDQKGFGPEAVKH